MKRIFAAGLLASSLCLAPAIAETPDVAPAPETPAPQTSAPEMPAPEMAAPGMAAPDAAPAIIPAGMPDDPVSREVRCFYVYMAIGTSDKPDMQAAAIIGTFFWYGRLSGKLSDAELEQRISTVIDVQTSGGLKADAQRCGTEMAERGQAMRDLGDHLQQKGQDEELKKAPQKTPQP